MEYAKIEWRDGSPYSSEYKDIYYSRVGGYGESEYVFLRKNDLPERWAHTEKFTIAETGFGTGLNFILTVKAWLATSETDAKLHYVGIEKHPVSPDDIKKLSESFPELVKYFNELLSVYPLPVNGSHPLSLFGGRVRLYLYYMDAEEALCEQRFLVDAWYLDGFSPDKNPDLWSSEIFGLIAQNSKLGTTLSTYTCAGSVRRGLESSGFEVSKVKGHGNKREMIVAIMSNNLSYCSTFPWYDIPQFKSTSKEITVIGAGLAGLSVAWSFVLRGWNVTVIDKYKEVAKEASGNPAGLLLPRLSLDNKPESLFYSSAYMYAINRLNVLQDVDENAIWFNDGVVSIHKKAKIKSIIDKFNYPKDFLKLLSDSESFEFKKDTDSEVCFFPNGGWASPHGICEAMLKACGDQLIFLTADVGDLRRIESEWNILDKQGDLIKCSEIVVVANGSGINTIDALRWIPVSAVRGQMTELNATKKSEHLKHSLSFDAFVTPQHKGIHYLGASYSLNETTDELLEQDQQENFSKLEKRLPGVFDYPSKLNGRVGFRMVSQDRMPVVGAVPDANAFERDYSDLHHGRPSENYGAGQYLPGLYVTAAHGSRGLCSCFLSAEILVAMIEGSPLPVSKEVADVLNPARFLIRDFKRNRY